MSDLGAPSGKGADIRARRRATGPKYADPQACEAKRAAQDWTSLIIIPDLPAYGASRPSRKARTREAVGSSPESSQNMMPRRPWSRV